MQNQVLIEGVKDPIKIQWAVENPFEEAEEERKTKQMAEEHLAKMKLGKRPGKQLTDDKTHKRLK
jgi:hypothetical protein